MAQAIPLVTHAAPSADGAARTETAVAQALLMARGSAWRDHVAIDAVLNAEGLTMPGGELSTGASGEGYVDRRHPHAYLHELVLTALGTVGPLAWSASAGRGFVPFGTDDPMMRPMEKYPINHHLAQVLERALATAAVRAGPALLEGGIFGGDEPTSPSSLPRRARLGDSWAIRATALPRNGLELQGSVAHVASPEEAGGFGLDQRKRSASMRVVSQDGARYLLAEWARTIERDHDRRLDAFAYESALVEGALAAGLLGVAARLEQTDRPEESRLADPFRTPRPANDLAISGITRWRVATVQLSTRGVTAGALSGFPFVEVARLAASPRDDRAVFSPERFYGTSRFWMVTAGVRLRAGGAHARMGRYGVALPAGPPIGVPADAREASHHH